MTNRYQDPLHKARNREILRLHNKGLSGSKIAKMLGLKSRNVVAGVVDRWAGEKRNLRGEEGKPIDTGEYEISRLKNQNPIDAGPYDGLTARAPCGVRSNKFEAYLKKPLVQRKPVERVEDADMGVLELEIQDLRPTHCRWPLWISDDCPRRYCGRAKNVGKPYCKEHEARACRSGTY